MKILIPLEIPDDSDFLAISVEAFSTNENKMLDREYEAFEIGEFARYYKLFQEEVTNKGVL